MPVLHNHVLKMHQERESAMEAFREDDTLYTVEDIYALPEGKRAELIDGQIYYMAAPSRTHQRLLLSISRRVADYIDANGGDCEVNVAPFAVFLNNDSLNYVEPDILVVCDPSKLDEKGCHGAPDWIMEIVSPASRTMDYMKKILKYMAAGVREYWIVDPEKKHVTVYFFEKESVKEYAFGEEVPAGIYEGFSIRVE